MAGHSGLHARSAHSRRVRPSANRIAPIAARAMGARVAKRSSIVPASASSSTVPKPIRTTPLTSDAMSGLAVRRIPTRGPSTSRTADVAFAVVAVEPVALSEANALARVVDLDGAHPDVGVEHQALGLAPGGGPVAPVDVDARVVAVEHLDRTHAELRAGCHADVVRDDHLRIPHAEIELQRGIAGGQVGVGQIDGQLAHAELVVLADLRSRGGLVVAVAHAAVEVDSGRGYEA